MRIPVKKIHKQYKKLRKSYFSTKKKVKSDAIIIGVGLFALAAITAMIVNGEDEELGYQFNCQDLKVSYNGNEKVLTKHDCALISNILFDYSWIEMNQSIDSDFVLTNSSQSVQYDSICGILYNQEKGVGVTLTAQHTQALNKFLQDLFA